MVDVFIYGITRSYSIMTVHHYNRITFNVFHNVALCITCMSCFRILVNTFVAITVKRA